VDDPAGLRVKDLSALGNLDIEYTAQIPVLIAWLPRVEYEMERFPDHEQGWVRRDAKRALARLTPPT
jgi:hypothetical protein